MSNSPEPEKAMSLSTPIPLPLANGKGIGVDNDIAFSGSGELDNGFTVSVSHVLDTNDNVTNSSTQLAVGMGSFGTLQVNQSGGASTNSIDDVLPFAYEELLVSKW